MGEPIPGPWPQELKLMSNNVAARDLIWVPPTNYGGGDGTGTENMELNERVTRLEEALKKFATNAQMYAAIGASTAFTVTTIICVMLYLHGDLKDTIGGVDARLTGEIGGLKATLHSVDDRLDRIEVDVSSIKANVQHNTNDIQYIRQRLDDQTIKE